ARLDRLSALHQPARLVRDFGPRREERGDGLRVVSVIRLDERLGPRANRLLVGIFARSRIWRGGRGLCERFWSRGLFFLRLTGGDQSEPDRRRAEKQHGQSLLVAHGNTLCGKT